MSIKIMSEIWDSAEAEGATLLILLALADFSNEEGQSWPSIASLCRKSRVSERRVHEIIHELSTTGLLTVERNAGPNGVNVYTLMPRGALSAPLNSTAGVRKNTPGGVAASAPKPSLEPSLGTTTATTTARARKERETNREPHVALMASLYEQTVGGLTPTLADLIRDSAEHVPKSKLGERWIRHAFREAAASGHASLRYVLAVLKRGEDTGWPADMEVKRDGRTSQAGSGPARKGARLAAVGPGGPDLDAWDRYARGEDG